MDPWVDRAAEEFVRDLFWPSPYIEVDIDEPSNNPFLLCDRFISDGSLSEGMIKIKLFSSSGAELPRHRDECIRSGDFRGLIGEGADLPTLVGNVGTYSLETVVEGRIYRRLSNSTPAKSLSSLALNWGDQGRFNLSFGDMEASFAATWRKFRDSPLIGASGTSEWRPYVADRNMSAFKFLYPDLEQHFQVSLSAELKISPS